MEFDYQQIKDAEARHREELLGSLPIPRERLMPRPQLSESPPTRGPPPIKPRRSIKVHPRREGVGPPHPPRKQLDNSRDECAQKDAPAPPCCPVSLAPLSPSLRAHTLLWFQQTQLSRLQRSDGTLPDWLHGFATRREAEELLKDQELGSFLLRLSESKVGFVLSYRGTDRCRHFIIDEVGGGQYVIAGEESCHSSLQDLVSYYSRHPVGPFSETLTAPCRKSLCVLPQAGGGCREALDELPIREKPSAPEGQAAGGGQLPPQETPPETEQYAVVKKPLRKMMERDSDRKGHQCFFVNLQVPDFIPPPPKDPLVPPAGEAQEKHEDAPYARVNKPRASPQAPAPSSPPAAQAPAQPVAPSAPVSLGGSEGGEQKYWELVPMHTYEETGHLTEPRDETRRVYSEPDDPIAFYAMGRSGRGGTQAQGAADPLRHLYSEVNLRGSDRPGADHPGSTLPPPSAPLISPQPAHSPPELPLRPPPRLDCMAQRRSGTPEVTFNPRSGVPLPLRGDRAPPLDSSASIYEQIRDRDAPPSNSSRPAATDTRRGS
uniref:Si:ch73-109i22.2 n=1 Tax=Lepisosteus oculatus TaxID=7918 RepID=W5MKG2_LEPOC